MTCINPIAPFCETARASPKLSTRITARIQLSGMLNRCAASVTKTAKGRAAGGQAGRPRSAGSRPRTAGRSSRKRQRSPRHKSRSEAASGARRRSAGAGAAAKRRQAEARGGWPPASQQRESLAGKRERFKSARRAKTPSSNCAQTACSLLFGGSMGPKRSGAADDRGGGQRSEVPPVKRVGRPRFMRKTSPTARTRQPCQTGSGRPRLSRSTRFADRNGVDADGAARCGRRTVRRAPRTCFTSGTPRGR